VLVMDDTMVLRGDAPDVFTMVQPMSLGASVEDELLRPVKENLTLMKLSLLKYWPRNNNNNYNNNNSLHHNDNKVCVQVEELLLDHKDVFDLFPTQVNACFNQHHHYERSVQKHPQAAAPHSGAEEVEENDFRWFNSGFVVYSSHHLYTIFKSMNKYEDQNHSHNQEEEEEEGRSNHQLVTSFASWAQFQDQIGDSAVLWDQGWINAHRVFHHIPLFNLGYKFNWVGSFNGSNAVTRPLDALDAFAVHATTGLPNYGRDRLDFISYVDEAWMELGL
jgi:hypothetical protein